MIPDDSAVIEYAPNSPCVAERVILCGQTAEDTLKRMLTRFGLSPHLIGFRKGDQEICPGEILIVSRDATGAPATIGRIMWGVSPDDLRQAGETLLADGWQPRPSAFDMTLPNGTAV